MNGKLKISVLDVGHGDFIYAESPFGHTLVIDCGSGDVIPSKFLSKVSTIDELQISHPHEDHFSDIVSLSKKTIRSFRCIPLGRFSDDAIAWRTQDKGKVRTLRELKAAISANNDAVPVGNGFDHTVYYPSNSDINFDDPNTASSVTTLSYGSFKMLFGGDMTSSGWEAMLQNPSFVSAIKGTTVYKVSHHGRDVGCSNELFDVISPRLCIISDKSIDSSNENTECVDWYCNRASGCRIVKADGTAEERQVLTTRNDGSIHLQIDNGGSWWCYKQTGWK